MFGPRAKPSSPTLLPRAGGRRTNFLVATRLNSFDRKMKHLPTSFFVMICLCTNSQTFAQRAAVSGAEVTGTFRSYFKGIGRGSYNEILIQALGGNKLKVEMNLIYPYKANREALANVGEVTGEANIKGDTAIFVPDYAKENQNGCRITLKFNKRGSLVVTTENNLDCGFGFNVEADGTYRKTSAAKPKFTE